MKRNTARIPLRRPQRPAAEGAWRSWLNQAIQAHQQGDLDTAEHLYRKILTSEIAQPDALHYLGVLQHQRGRSDEAVELIRTALAAIPNHADAHNNLGNIHKECGRLAEAEACYRRALACAPTHADALGNLAVVLEAQDRLLPAFEAYGKFLLAAPRSARAHYLMGLFLRHHAEGIEHVEQSVECFQRAFALDDKQLCALQEQGVSLYALGRDDEARQVYRDWLARDPGNPVPRHMLAACGGSEAPARADDAYVRAEFDSFAENFDRQLLGHLNYRAPQVLVDAMAASLPPAAATLDVLDAGCGTGLCAPLLRPYARRLIGVDLSAGMLDKARQRGGYDELAEAELTAYLQAHAAMHDVVVSADTLVYFGDLAPVVAAAHTALRPGGSFVFSLEAKDEASLDSGGFVLSSSGRYRHGRDYVEETLRRSGFADIRITPDSLRKEAGKPVASWVVLARYAPNGASMSALAGKGTPDI
ncbi:MAG: tetratricopeptide repeat protein [Xanthomonadales bacterium]|nr:tetratricopeptide repeat protein [Xanthomonadales bacterium]